MKFIATTVPFLIAASLGCSAGPIASRPNAVPDAQQGSGSAAVQRIEIVSETLSSGYGVVLARIPPEVQPSPGVFIGSYVRHGSMEETGLGWAHLMEHVAANNPPAIVGPTQPEGVRAINSNALARPYYTSFVTIAPPPLVPWAAHLRMAVAGRKGDDARVFTNEVGRVLAEIGRDTSGMWPAYKALVALSLGRSPRLADEIAAVRGADQQRVTEAMRPIYRPANAVLVIAGDIDLAATRAMVHETAARLRLDEVHRPASVAAAFPILRTGESAVVPDQNRGALTVVGVAWPKPPLGHPDQLPLLVADQLLLGRDEAVDNPARSEASPVGQRLARSLGGRGFWDGRAGTWGAPDMVDTGPGLYAITFSTDHDMTPERVREGVRTALTDIRRGATSDAEIEAATDALASYYERWLLEPTFRILADHLMAWQVTGRNPEQIKRIPEQIRRVRPAAVRTAIDRYLLAVEPLLVVLPSAPPPR